MMDGKRSAGWALLAALIVATGCAPAAEDAADAAADGPLSVHVVNYPLAYFAERIGGDAVDVHLPVPEGEDPVAWNPPDDVVAEYQQADLILLNGAGYAGWVERASLPEQATVDTTAAVTDRLLEVPDAHVHAHGDGPPHAHGGTASYTWLDPALATEQARAVKDALAARLPDAADAFEQRFEALAADLAALDERTQQLLAEHRDQPLLAAYPLYHYVQRRYDLSLEQLEWLRGEDDPSPDAWEALDQTLEQHPARWMLWPELPSSAIVAQLAERGVEPVLFAPGDQRPADGNLLDLLNGNVDRLEQALTEG